jgi:hypothetical protein
MYEVQILQELDTYTMWDRASAYAKAAEITKETDNIVRIIPFGKVPYIAGLNETQQWQLECKVERMRAKGLIVEVLSNTARVNRSGRCRVTALVNDIRERWWWDTHRAMWLRR